MQPDLWTLYRQMLYSRLFELAVQQLWESGDISGEMHLGTGEEAIAAGVISHLRDGDAMALDHRGTPPLLMRGIDPVALLREFLGRSDGLCGGMGGHMHLFSPEHLAASSGIVGSAGPAVAGFALAAQRLRPGTVAVAFFGEGAMNQGMLLESLNLSGAWNLPAVFVCKDSGWAITTESRSVTGGTLTGRAEGLGVPAVELDGTDVEAVWETARRAIDRARADAGPSFLHARCVHLEGHFVDDPLLAAVRRPLREAYQMVGPVTRSLLAPKGAPLIQRLGGLRALMQTVGKSSRDVSSHSERDPVARAREKLAGEPDRLTELEEEVTGEVESVLRRALLPITTESLEPE